VSQRFLNLIRTGQTAEVAAAAEEDPSLIACRDAQGVSAFLLSIYHGQPLIRDFLLGHLASLDIFEACALGDCGRIERLLRQDAMLVHESSGASSPGSDIWWTRGNGSVACSRSTRAPFFAEPHAQPAIACVHCAEPQLRDCADSA
jgi:hypothetical protein